MALDLSDPDIRFALDTVREAAVLSRMVQRDLVTPALTKDDRSPVTVADFAAQAVAGRRLETYASGTPLVGEENAAMLRSGQGAASLARVTEFVSRCIPGASPDSVCAWIDRGGAEPCKRFWTLDPVDGTKGFLRHEQYAAALALVENGRVRIGALGCPNLDRGCSGSMISEGVAVIAVRGQGAWACPLEGDGPLRRLSVSARSRIQDARVLRSVESGHTNVGQMGTLLARLGITAEPILMDSQAKYAVLASGCGDLLFRLLSPKQPDYREKIWDQAAGSIIVEEAGGRITDIHGQPLDFSAGRTLANNRGVCASNGVLHDAALGALRALTCSG